MKLNKKRVLLLICGIILVVSAYFLYTRLSSPWVKGYELPKDILTRGDAYITSIVGEEYFEKNYQFDSEKSHGKKNINRNRSEYFLYYNYLPASRLSGQKQLIFVRIFGKPDLVPYDTVACIEYDKICEPTITRDEAIAIVEKMNIPEFNRDTIWTNLDLERITVINKTNKWLWTIRMRVEYEDPNCMAVRTINVNAHTGETQDLGVSMGCA